MSFRVGSRTHPTWLCSRSVRIAVSTSLRSIEFPSFMRSSTAFVFDSAIWDLGISSVVTPSLPTDFTRSIKLRSGLKKMATKTRANSRAAIGPVERMVRPSRLLRQEGREIHAQVEPADEEFARLPFPMLQEPMGLRMADCRRLELQYFDK